MIGQHIGLTTTIGGYHWDICWDVRPTQYIQYDQDTRNGIFWRLMINHDVWESSIEILEKSRVIPEWPQLSNQNMDPSCMGKTRAT